MYKILDNSSVYRAGVAGTRNFKNKSSLPRLWAEREEIEIRSVRFLKVTDESAGG